MTDLVAKKLKQCIPEIINLWEERVLQEVEAARLQRKLVLRNSLKGFLEQLVEELSDGQRSQQEINSSKTISTNIGKEHGKSRAESIQYTIDQLIYEYHVLRQVTCLVLERENALNSSSREIIVTYIEEAVNHAATEFSKTLKDIQNQLSRTLAHDLRNPIAIAKASAELILRRPDEKKNCIDKAGRISNSMDRIDKMIRELLDTTRMKAGEKIPFDFKECDIDWIIHEVAYEMNLSIPGKVIVESKHPSIGFWNEDALQRIVENLVNNAIKYGDQAAPVLVILEGDENFVSLKVHNEGSPILEKDKKMLFQAFHRGESTKDQKAGWGIGLSVVKTLVDAHRGKITVDSKEGEGTTFCVTIPIDPRMYSIDSLHQ